MGNHNICLYKEVDKKFTGCNLKTTEFLDCALIGVCAVVRSITVLLQRVYYKKKEFAPGESKFFPFTVDFFQEGGKIILTELPFLKAYLW